MPTAPPRFALVKPEPRQAWQQRTGPTVERIRGRAGMRQRKAHLTAEPMCRTCYAQGIVTIEALEVDHITPLAEGGTDTHDNRQTLCKPCHRAKTAQEASRGQRRARA